jgi:phage gp46-like protein
MAYDILVYANGQPLTRSQVLTQPLYRAVFISLFTWRRAAPDDALPSDQRMGWWGDGLSLAANDQIGSRLWLLMRSALTQDVIQRANDYCAEALRWIVDDQLASDITVSAERIGLDGLAITVTITRDGEPVELRFADVWKVFV